jgi:hypothetical protein
MGSEAPKKTGFNAIWSMAVGGMVGGGIFAVLGVIVQIAGSLAWLSFLIGGPIVLATAASYAHLARTMAADKELPSFLAVTRRDSRSCLSPSKTSSRDRRSRIFSLQSPASSVPAAKASKQGSMVARILAACASTFPISRHPWYWHPRSRRARLAA